MKGLNLRWSLLLSLSAPGLLLSGCVERWIFIRSHPAGARVFLDGREVGETPTRVPFDHYGTREILLRREGHASATRNVELRAPWYQWFPLDFVSEHLWPGKLVDQHEVTVNLNRRSEGALEAQLDAAQTTGFPRPRRPDPKDPR